MSAFFRTLSLWFSVATRAEATRPHAKKKRTHFYRCTWHEYYRSVFLFRSLLLNFPFSFSLGFSIFVIFFLSLPFFTAYLLTEKVERTVAETMKRHYFFIWLNTVFFNTISGKILQRNKKIFANFYIVLYILQKKLYHKICRFLHNFIFFRKFLLFS